MKYELKIIVFALSLLLASLFMIQPAYASCNDPDVAKRGPECPAGLDQIELIFQNVISVIAGLGFIAMLVMLIRAGIGYLTSGGEPKAVQQAHFTVTWALLGILFMAIAWLILQLIKNFTGIDVVSFNVKALCVGPADILQYCQP